jgi:hypothetical protein
MRLPNPILMTKNSKIILVAAVAVAAVVTPIVWHHYRTPAASKPPQASLDKPSRPLPDDAKSSAMTADQVARAFFEACGREDWDGVAKFWPPGAPPLEQRFKDYLGGLQIVSLGKPFQKTPYPGTYVPYEIRFKNGDVKKFNLAVRQDNPARRWFFDGGL